MSYNISDNIKILGVKVSTKTVAQTRIEIKSFMSAEGKYQVVTTNPEFVLEAVKDHEYLEVLNSSDLSTCDGIGLMFAAKYKNELSKIKSPLENIFVVRALVLLKVFMLGVLSSSYLDVIRERVTGTDLFLDVIKGKITDNPTIYLIGTRYQSGEESATAAKNTITTAFTSAKVVGARSGREYKGKIYHIDTILNSMNHDLADKGVTKVDFLFVAFGQKTQELWIKENLSRLPCKVAIGIGGAFDFLSGKTKRAPLFIQKIKLEWLYRLVRNPSKERFRRIINAVIVFPYYLLTYNSD